MKQIGIISDTHGFLDEAVFKHFSDCDEIWHAGDFGDQALADQLASLAPLRGVYGNIDGADIRQHFPLQEVFYCESLKVLIRHIGGRPPRYNPETRQALADVKPDLFLCGHSHILRISYEEKDQCLYVNPGAAGKQGWHQVRTLVKLVVDGKNIRNAVVIELGKK